MSEKFGSLPILAHELGHAKDYEEGTLNNPTVTSAIKGIGAGLGLASAVLVPRLFFSKLADYHPALPVGAGLASLLAITGLSSYWAHKRTMQSERTATDKAKKALTRAAERLGKQKELKNSGVMLDRAFDTYETAANTEMKDLLADVIKFGGLVTMLSAK